MRLQISTTEVTSDSLAVIILFNRNPNNVYRSYEHIKVLKKTLDTFGTSSAGQGIIWPDLKSSDDSEKMELAKRGEKNCG